jgi:hypothetical protein
MTAYLTVSEADALVALHKLSSERMDWDNATADDRNIALRKATMRIDRLNYVGDRNDTAVAAGNQFPRGTDTEVPDNIKMACLEEAFAILSGVNPELEAQNLNIVSSGFGNVRTTYRTDILFEHTAAGITSSEAWKFLAGYLRDVQTVRSSRG